VTDKSIHIVFQVLNFCSSEYSLSYNLSPEEELLLIYLAKHRGVKGIFPSIATLATERHKSRRTIMRSIQSLEQKKLIHVERSQGRSSHYHLIIPDTKLSTTSDTHVTSDIDDTSDTYVTPPVTSVSPTSDTGVTLYNKVSNRVNKTERAAPSLFEPNEANQTLALELQVDIDQELSSFRERKKKALQTQYEFERWIHGAAQYKRNIQAKKQDLSYPNMIDWTQERLDQEDKARLERIKQGGLLNGRSRDTADHNRR
jgi:hypothetical protein